MYSTNPVDHFREIKTPFPYTPDLLKTYNRPPPFFIVSSPKKNQKKEG